MPMCYDDSDCSVRRDEPATRQRAIANANASVAHRSSPSPKKGKKLSAEQCSKMSAVMMGRKPSEETRAKLRIAIKASWDARRAKKLQQTQESQG